MKKINQKIITHNRILNLEFSPGIPRQNSRFSRDKSFFLLENKDL